MNSNETNGEITIDLVELLAQLWKKKIFILSMTVIVGVLAMILAAFILPPEYQSSAMIYVNNTSTSRSQDNSTITSAEITAAKSLLSTYVVILRSPTTLQYVIDRTGLDYSQAELKSMISASAVDSTEIFKATVTAHDPSEAKLIADTLVEVLPDRIASIVDGSSVRIVDEAALPTARSAPSVSRYTAIGILLGFVVSCCIIVVAYLLDNTVHDVDSLKNITDLPVLAIIPDMEATNKNGYYKYSYQKKEKM